jgi:hypothetical protein
MNSTALAYYIYESARVPVLPLYWLARLMLFKRVDIFPRHREIVIAQLGPKENADPLFVSRTIAALDFIAETDPRRFRRVQRYIKAIIYGNKRSLATYHRHLPGCFVGFSNFNFEEDAPYKVPLYACVLVHEATHGIFYARHIPYTKRSREIIEFNCTMEEWRFAQRFPPSEIDWKSIIWEKVVNRAWDKPWNESWIHRFQSIYFSVKTEFAGKGAQQSVAGCPPQGAPSAEP